MHHVLVSLLTVDVTVTFIIVTDVAWAGEALQTNISASAHASDPSLEVVVFMLRLPVCDADLVTSVDGS